MAEMKQLKFTTVVNASSKLVWEVMLGRDTYNQWCRAFSENSQYVGKWERGEKVKFIDPEMGGTLALLEVVEPYKHIVARHIAILSKDHQEDTESEIAKKWIDSTETYVFDEKGFVTTLRVEIKTHEDFVDMFNQRWPVALGNLKEIVEKL